MLIVGEKPKIFSREMALCLYLLSTVWKECNIFDKPGQATLALQ